MNWLTDIVRPKIQKTTQKEISDDFYVFVKLSNENSDNIYDRIEELKSLSIHLNETVSEFRV